MNIKAMQFAIQAHEATNHRYDEYPYSIHLIMVYSNFEKYKYLIPIIEHETVEAGVWLHDTIEDARITYNDIAKRFGNTVADLVIALTNIRGKDRSERGGDEYYKGISQCSRASFIKICDRLANVQRAIYSGSTMLATYKKEHATFAEKLTAPEVRNYEPMLKELDRLFILA